MSDVMPDYPDVVLGIVIVDCADPEKLAAFWSELLGRKITNEQGTFVGLEWAPRFGAGLCFQRVPEPKVGKNRLHMDLICADINATAARVEELGGKHADGYPDHPGVIVMLDPEDNEFCLVPPPGS
jgi:predicted enzyme related to lactoylglutathione lyase